MALNIDTSPTGPLSFLYSRKAWISVLVIIVFAVLLYLDKITTQVFTETIQYVFTVWVGAMAVEKGAKALGNKKTDGTTVNVTQPTTQTHDAELEAALDDKFGKKGG